MTLTQPVLQGCVMGLGIVPWPALAASPSADTQEVHGLLDDWDYKEPLLDQS